MELWQKQAIFAQNIAFLLRYIHDQGYFVTFGEAFRTQEQAKIYAHEGKGIVDSLHCKRLALDINLLNETGKYLIEYEDYKKFGDYWVTLHENNRWGGSFKRVDSNHFEMQDI